MGKLLKRSWDSWCGHVALLREQEEQSRQAAFNDPVGHALGNVFGGIAFWDNNGGLQQQQQQQITPTTPVSSPTNRE